tara:strand:- start:4602 stop:5873 length:1272 start_codon:yes stop_codon:yes gene_type:complete
MLLKLIGAAVAFLWQLIVFRSLSPTGAGIYSFGIALFRILSTIGTLGTDRSMIVDIPKIRFIDRADLEFELLTAATTVGTILSIVLITFASLYFRIQSSIDIAYAQLFFLLSIGLPFAVLLKIYAGALKAHGAVATSDFLYVVLPPIISTFVSLIYNIFFGTITVDGIATAFVVSQVVGLLATLIVYFQRRKLAFPSIGGVLLRIREYTTNGWWYLAIILSTAGLQDLLSVVLGAFSNPVEVAAYAIAVRYIILIKFISGSVIQQFEPTLSYAYHSGNFTRLRECISNVSTLQLFVVLPILLIFFVFSESALKFFGPDFGPYLWVLRFMIIGEAVNAVTGISGSLLIISGHVNKSGTYALIGSVSALGLCVLLSPELGAEAAGVAYILAIIITKLLSNITIWRRFHVRTDILYLIIRPPAHTR